MEQTLRPAEQKTTLFTAKPLLLARLSGGHGRPSLGSARYQIIHAGSSLSEFHYIHTHASVTMEERITKEHSCEVLCNPFAMFLVFSMRAQQPPSEVREIIVTINRKTGR